MTPPDTQSPIDPLLRDVLLGTPTWHVYSYPDMLEAVKAYMIWNLAEDKNLGTFQDKMDMCSYAEWAGKKALGLPHDKEWKGVPRIAISLVP